MIAQYICRFCGFCLLWFLTGGVLQAENHLCIDKNRMTISLLSETDTLMRFPISCGRGFGPKQKQGDMRTPEGTYKILSFTDSRAWGHDFKDGLGYIREAYGPWFIRLSAGNGIGIHGTHAPESMGLRASEGCIRLKNEDLLKLKPQLRKGMMVVILPDSFPPVPGPEVSDLTLPVPKASLIEKSNIE